MSIKTIGNWVSERSSGCDGYRCRRCGTWVYENMPRNCQSDEYPAKQSFTKSVECPTCKKILVTYTLPATPVLTLSATCLICGWKWKLYE